MRKALIIAAILAVATPAMGFERELQQFDAAPPYGLSQDCLLEIYNACAGWIWAFVDAPGNIWGVVLDPNDCEAGCTNGGAVSDIFAYFICDPGPPAMIGGVDVELVDAVGCPTAMLWHSGPLTIENCTSAGRWNHVTVPIEYTHLNGEKFAITYEWGPSDPVARFCTDSGSANLSCMLTPAGCYSTDYTCAGWSWTDPGQQTFVYIMDIDGDTVMDDICAMYGYPYPLNFPYVTGYGYLPNNLFAVAGLDCHSPTAVENTSWGHVKALYE